MRIVLALLGVFVVGFAAEQDEVTLLRWAGPPGSRPETRAEGKLNVGCNP
ncbi:MAG: hypothetical protein ABIK62_08215 [candidate division WOR-3 bacterium]